MFIYKLITKNGIIFLLFDKDDANIVDEYSFYYNDVTGYITCRSKIDKNSYPIYLHRLIANVPEGLVGDHVNGNLLDFRRSNIQAILQKNNLQKKRKPRQYNNQPTSSEYKGVCWNIKLETWYAYIRLDGLLLNLGNYPDPNIAAAVYNVFAHTLFGRFANPNIIQGNLDGLSQVDFPKLHRRIFLNLLKHGILCCKLCPISSHHAITIVDSINYYRDEIPEWLDTIIADNNFCVGSEHGNYPDPEELDSEFGDEDDDEDNGYD